MGDAQENPGVVGEEVQLATLISYQIPEISC